MAEVKFLLISNYFKCECIKLSNKKIEIGTINFNKTLCNYLLFMRDSL